MSDHLELLPAVDIADGQAVQLVQGVAGSEKRERRTARTRAVSVLVPKRHSRQTGVLAERRRRRAGLTLALVVALNVLVWVFVPDWPTRAMVLCVSLLAAPVLHVLLSKR